MRDKTLILGAAGFIGTNLTIRLLEENKKLILFDRNQDGYQNAILSMGKNDNVDFWNGYFTEMDREDWMCKRSFLSEVHTAYHFISTTCPTNSNINVEREVQDNLISTIRFLDVCVECGIPKVVFLSSGGTVYGREHTGLCKEEDEAYPITAYGMQKLCIEKTLYLYRQMYGLDYRIIRLANPYGPYQRPDGVQGVVTTFTWKMMNGYPITIYGDGSVVRDYIYIDDAIDGILKIADSKTDYRLYNLGSGKGKRITDIIDLISDILEKKPQIVYEQCRKVDVPMNVLDIERFKSVFGEPVKTDMRRGIEKTILFFQDQKKKS